MINIRTYNSRDAQATLNIFIDAVMGTAGHEYTHEQAKAWADREHRDLEVWNRNRSTVDTTLAVEAGRVVGFIDVDSTGYINMLFVQPDCERRGIGALLLESVIELHPGTLITHASARAMPFFKKFGFEIQEEQHQTIRAVEIKNFWLKREVSRTA